MAFPALLLICVILIALLPYIPAVYEWLRPTDIAPLPVRRNEINNLRYLADSFRLRITTALGVKLPNLQDLQTNLTYSISNNVYIVHQRLADDANTTYHPDALEILRKSNGIVILVHDARLPPGSQNHADLFAVGDLAVGAGASLRACSAQGVIHLGANAVVHRWIDARCIRVGGNASIDGRVTAIEEIDFADGSQFVRAGAPSMHFGVSGDTAEAAPSAPAVRARHVLDDGAEPSPEASRNGDFVVRGAYRVLPGTTVFGNIKTYGDLRLEQRSRVAGSIVSNKNIVLERGCSVLGPVISQNDIAIGPDCRIGTPDAATTMICRTLTIAAGCIVHGVITTQEGATVTSGEIPDAI